jgi:Fe2+ or Zn2+ uptake regulation protein
MMTKQRKLILDIILSSMQHLTADEIYLQAKKTQPSIAVGTVYRNLGLLTDSGEIRRIHIQNSPDRYDQSLLPHEHMICHSCGAISDLSVTDLKKYLEQQTGIEILGYDLNVRYLCTQCRKQEISSR